jgi:hypothetical protein
VSLALLRERQGSVAERAALAADQETAPELLIWLAGDPAPAVRIAVAANRATPPQAGLLLAEDADATVRATLARRVGALSPGLADAAQTRRTRMTAAILDRLVEDVAVEVRAALAESVAGLADAPRDLILRLARDTAIQVAGPVLRLSPLLTDADLLALVAAPPARVTRRAIAARPKLSEAVAEAVVASADRPAIAALLGNGSAAIREATLDRLVAGAAEEPSWQAALVRRPALPAHAQRALGAMIAGHLLEVLAARPDLPEGLAETLKTRIEERLAAAAPSQEAAREAARAGDRDALLDLLSAGCGYAPERIDAALTLRSARVLTALCWRAGWTPEVAEEVQTALGVDRARVIRANAEGEWTLSPSELQWQIELLEELPAEPTTVD